MLEKLIVDKCKSNPKLLFSYVNSKKNVKCKIRSLTDKFENQLVNGNDRCLNDHFFSSFKADDLMNMEPEFPLRTQVDCILNPEIAFSPGSIKKKLDELDKNKSLGTEGIHPYVLRECNGELCKPLSLVFNL